MRVITGLTVPALYDQAVGDSVVVRTAADQAQNDSLSIARACKLTRPVARSDGDYKQGTTYAGELARAWTGRSDPLSRVHWNREARWGTTTAIATYAVPHNGANSVFVGLAVAANAVHRAGGSDDLDEWRGAAACERKYCKPDGYGCYVRNGATHGFFLEYDRGTESTRTYLAKFRAYYSYRDSREADLEYNGFPTLLFVTTQPHAEERIADAATRAGFLRGTEPLAVLITTTSRITSNRDAVLGRIWRRPGQIGATAEDERQYWLTEGAPGELVGAGRIGIAPSQLAWSTTRAPRNTKGGKLADAAGMPRLRGGSPPFKNPANAPGLSRSELQQHQRPASDRGVASQ